MSALYPMDGHTGKVPEFRIAQAAKNRYRVTAAGNEKFVDANIGTPEGEGDVYLAVTELVGESPAVLATAQKYVRHLRGGGVDAGPELDTLQAVAVAGLLATTARPRQGIDSVAQDEPWGDPLPLPDGLPPVMVFDMALLPESFKPWIEDITERMQCPPDYAAIAAMIAAASLIGRKIGIRPKRQDDWLVIPNLWGVAIGRPGVMKKHPRCRNHCAPQAVGGGSG